MASAIASEVGATTCLKLADGFTKPVPSVGVVVGYAAAFVLLALVLKSMSVGVVYAIWAGTGTALVAVVSALFLGEAIEWPAWLGICLIVVGVVLVEAFSEGAPEAAEG
ncbi:MAG: multidrug efflux SMR transporter [Solirubrobacterales bacterium]